MKAAVNRVLLAFKTWEERKKEMEPLIKAGSTDEPTVAGMQLAHLRQARHRLREAARPDEKPFLALLNNHITKLEKQLYPTLLRRMFSLIKDRLFDGPKYMRQQMQQRASNMENIKAQLRDAGLQGIAGKLENHLDADQKRVCLPLDCRLHDGKGLSFDLHFEKDPHDDFQFYRINASLLKDGKLVRKHEFELNDWPNLGTKHIWNLLEGHALRQTFTNSSGHESQRWVELGPNGAQHYDPDHDFDIKTVISGLPSLTGNTSEMVNYLENGQSLPAYWKVGQHVQKIIVQADPASKTLKFFDEKNKSITAEQLNHRAEKLGRHIKSPVALIKRIRKGVKNGLQH